METGRTLRNDGIYTAKEIALILRTDIRRIYRLAYAGEIPSIEIGGRKGLRLLGWAVAQWLSDKSREGSMEE